MALCLAGAGAVVRLAIGAFTLAWTHTVEKTPWEESWRVTDQALVLTESRVKGSGAGMDPAPGARLVDGWYVWQPRDGARDRIVLLRNAATDDWRVCAEGMPCATLGALIGGDADSVTLSPCP